MNRLFGSVGAGATNNFKDVMVVQRLLSKRPGIGKLAQDGRVGPKTIGAIRRFQGGPVGMRNPDGRVDPTGKTIRALRAPASRPKPPSPSGQKAAPSSAEQRRVDSKARTKFVRPGVKETGLTRQIIDGITPAFEGKRATVISAYMNDADLFWKVNYHWDYVLWMLEHALILNVGKTYRNRMRSLTAGLKACAPRPATGYRTSPVGKPADTSSMRDMTKRHKVVSQAKRDFKAIIQQAGLKRLSNRAGKSFDYSVAPVAHPGTSKHASGYALDIMGDNTLISDTCKRLGASLVFDEKSHVHVEFKHGVSPTER